MKKFAFISTNYLKESYNFFLNKQRSKKYFMDFIKIAGLAAFVLLCGFFYLRYVSLSSTEGYFLRQANNELASTNFQHEIVKTELLNKVQINRESMYGNSQTKSIVDVSPEIVKIPNKTELTYK